MSRQYVQLLLKSLDQDFSKSNSNKADFFLHVLGSAVSPPSPEDICWRKGGEAHLRAHLQVLETFLGNVICDTVTSTQCAKKKTIGARDVVCAMKHSAPTLLGFRGKLLLIQQSKWSTKGCSITPTENYTKCSVVLGY